MFIRFWTTFIIWHATEFRFSSSQVYSKLTAYFPGYAVMHTYVCQIGIKPASYLSPLRAWWRAVLCVCVYIYRPESYCAIFQIYLVLYNSLANSPRPKEVSISSLKVQLYKPSSLTYISYTTIRLFKVLSCVLEKNCFAYFLIILHTYRLFLYNWKMEVENTKWCSEI